MAVGVNEARRKKAIRPGVDDLGKWRMRHALPDRLYLTAFDQQRAIA